jgi:hypothetical protein
VVQAGQAVLRVAEGITQPNERTRRVAGVRLLHDVDTRNPDNSGRAGGRLPFMAAAFRRPGTRGGWL